jgi:hypothetical protein
MQLLPGATRKGERSRSATHARDDGGLAGALEFALLNHDPTIACKKNKATPAARWPLNMRGGRESHCLNVSRQDPMNIMNMTDASALAPQPSRKRRRSEGMAARRGSFARDARAAAELAVER